MTGRTVVGLPVRFLSIVVCDTLACICGRQHGAQAQGGQAPHLHVQPNTQGGGCLSQRRGRGSFSRCRDCGHTIVSTAEDLVLKGYLLTSGAERSSTISSAVRQLHGGGGDFTAVATPEI
ncbi:hypothetical protein C0Q70_00685 [Pomacea canaliculata]|uniref:Secreted protein n=1 Tax=Pomacea canaliculata TaxID=400727 RepID=A0A2T7PXC9_POMCA|nr:hypothetical protein C0Q70_00685 [Pomacea canaliculata]